MPPPPPPQKKKRKKERERGKIKNKKSLSVLLFPNEKFDLFLFALQNLKYHRGCQLINNEEWPSQLWTLFKQLQFMQMRILHTPTAVSHSLLSREYTFVWTQNSPAPNIGGFIAQLVRASNKYHEVMGSNLLKSWIFFRLFMQLYKLCSQLQGSFFIWFYFCSSYIHL